MQGMLISQWEILQVGCIAEPTMTGRINLTSELTTEAPQCTFRKIESHHPNFSLISLKDAPQKVVYTVGRLFLLPNVTRRRSERIFPFPLSFQSQKCKECNILFSLVLLGGLVCACRKCLNAGTLIKSSLVQNNLVVMDNEKLLIASQTICKQKVRTLFKVLSLKC